MITKFEQNMPLVSVIISTYNRVNIVGSAIIGAINQTYKNIEIIVVDDGSTDGTAEYISQLGFGVKYYYKENGGVSSARNMGVSKSSGKLIAFLDSDDEWLPNKLEKQVEYLISNQDFGMVLCDCFFVDSSRKRTETTNRRKNLPNDGYILKDVFTSPYLIPSSVLVKKEVLDDVGYFDESIRSAEDLDLHLRIACKYKIGLISEPLLSCMSGHSGLSMLSRTYDDHVYVVERFVKLNNIKELPVNNVLLKTYISAANGKFWLNEWRNGLCYTFKATNRIASTDDFMEVVKISLRGIKYLIRKLIYQISSEKVK